MTKHNKTAAFGDAVVRSTRTPGSVSLMLSGSLGQQLTFAIRAPLWGKIGGDQEYLDLKWKLRKQLASDL